jgi:hypothetical protein
MNNKESVFTEQENNLMNDYNISEEEVLELRKHRNSITSAKMKRDLDRMASGVKEKTAEEILLEEKKWTTERIMKVDNYREKNKAKRYEEDEKAMILESKPLQNAAIKIVKGLAQGLGFIIVNAVAGELRGKYDKNLKEGTGQGLKLGVNMFKERNRG